MYRGEKVAMKSQPIEVCAHSVNSCVHSDAKIVAVISGLRWEFGRISSDGNLRSQVAPPWKSPHVMIQNALIAQNVFGDGCWGLQCMNLNVTFSWMCVTGLKMQSSCSTLPPHMKLINLRTSLDSLNISTDLLACLFSAMLGPGCSKQRKAPCHQRNKNRAWSLSPRLATHAPSHVSVFLRAGQQ